MKIKLLSNNMFIRVYRRIIFNKWAKAHLIYLEPLYLCKNNFYGILKI